MSDQPAALSTEKIRIDRAWIIEHAHRTWDTPWGREYLAHLLKRLRFFDPIAQDDAVGVAYQNIARQLLEDLGISSTSFQDHLRFVESILDLPYELQGQKPQKEG